MISYATLEEAWSTYGTGAVTSNTFSPAVSSGERDYTHPSVQAWVDPADPYTSSQYRVSPRTPAVSEVSHKLQQPLHNTAAAGKDSMCAAPGARPRQPRPPPPPPATLPGDLDPYDSGASHKGAPMFSVPAPACPTQAQTLEQALERTFKSEGFDALLSKLPMQFIRRFNRDAERNANSAIQICLACFVILVVLDYFSRR